MKEIKFVIKIIVALAGIIALFAATMTAQILSQGSMHGAVNKIEELVDGTSD